MGKHFQMASHIKTPSLLIYKYTWFDFYINVTFQLVNSKTKSNLCLKVFLWVEQSTINRYKFKLIKDFVTNIIR